MVGWRDATLEPLYVERQKKWWKETPTDDIIEDFRKYRYKMVVVFTIFLIILIVAMLGIYCVGIYEAKQYYEPDFDYYKSFRNSLAEEICQFKFNESFSVAQQGYERNVVFCEYSHFSVES